MLVQFWLDVLGPRGSHIWTEEEQDVCREFLEAHDSGVLTIDDHDKWKEAWKVVIAKVGVLRRLLL